MSVWTIVGLQGSIALGSAYIAYRSHTIKRKGITMSDRSLFFALALLGLIASGLLIVITIEGAIH